MQCIIGLGNRQRGWGTCLHTVAAIGLVVLAALGIALESSGGWVLWAPQWVEKKRQRWQRRGRQGCAGFAWHAGWAWMRRSWMVTLVRSEALLLVAFLSEHWEWHGLCLLPWGVWLWRGLGVAWPSAGRQPLYQGLGRVIEEVGRLALVGLLLVWLAQHVAVVGGEGGLRVLSVGSVMSAPQIKVTKDERGWYQVRLKGEFELRVDGQVAFYKRLLIIFLGLMDVPGESRGSRRTRDGRTPFVRQQQMAAWFGVTGPEISRWRQYWLKQDWRRMLSRRGGDVFTLETQQRVIDTWVKFPWWGAERLWQHLQSQGERISLRHVRQAARESGWSALRQSLCRVYAVGAESFRPQDEWLVSQLLALLQQLVTQLEELGRLTAQQQIELADLEALSQELELGPALARAPLPWMRQLEHLLFGHWQPVQDTSVHCIYCGSTDVSRKSRKGRQKRYEDDQGQLHTVTVYRYYCHNSQCSYQSFTNLPPGLLPHSRQPLGQRMAALRLYVWGHSVYRRCGETLGVSKMTAYRWVSGFGYDLLPVAALFGVVRSSGVVGIDEKYVLVPKNDKPETKMKRWMYVYLAVDCYTYDLLHIEIYAYNNTHCAHAFLLALRAKGYQPRVILTDLRVDYGPLVALVFPKAIHHECIFHALQQVRQHIKDAYGTDYAETQPQVVTLKEEIDHIFEARTKRTAQRRYHDVLAQRDDFVSQTPAAQAIFDFLQHHWPKLINAIESRHIPTTNNATEQVIRIFNQRYKTFCGFESIESARSYLAVFEKVYRFTPFSDDAQPRIRGKCPLELAGYAVQKLPMAHICRGLALQWPALAFEELVPNV